MTASKQEVTLTPTQLRAWAETRTALLWHCPAFTHVLYTMMDKVGAEHIAVFTTDIPIAATDGSTLLLNPETFFGYSLNKRVFICAHEIMHAILDHCGLGRRFARSGRVPMPDGSSLPFDAMTMNVATDLIINDMLITSGVGEYEKGWLHDTAIATHKDSAIDAYRKLYQKGKGKSGASGGVKGSRFDEHLDPADDVRNEQEWQTAVAAGLAAAKAQGKLPANMELFFDKMLNPEVPWAEKIAAFFARKVGSGSYDWRRADRRLVMRDIYAPGRSGHGAGTVAVAIDTSGSIICDPTLLTRFMSELAGILEDVRPKRLMVLWIDAAVHAVDEVEEAGDIMALKPKGGGGTDFRPAFDWLAKENITPDALVYLTDGYGTFPQAAPEYPVLWGSITPTLPPTHYPFGEVVAVPATAKP
jgi:predicted metal-dependent peptidase